MPKRSQQEVYLEFPEFTLTYRPKIGEVETHYANWLFSTVTRDDTDEEHAERLGITAGEHKFVHELTHHLRGIALGRTSSLIIWCAAHNHAMPDDAEDEERDVHALIYRALGTPRPEDEYRYPILEQAGVCVEGICADIRHLLDLVRPMKGRLPIRKIQFR